MAALAKRRDIPVVFAVHNFAYDNPADFRHADYVTVPSRFSSEYYRQHLGLHCHVLPNVVDPTRVMASDRQPQYLTFVNPQPAKGLFVFSRSPTRYSAADRTSRSSWSKAEGGETPSNRPASI